LELEQIRPNVCYMSLAYKSPCGKVIAG